MGTRSLTKFQQEDGKEIVVMYRQYDGYPEGHGRELAEFLSPMRICNGFGSGEKAGEWANGMGCLAAQVVAHFKTEIGGIYLHAAGTTNCWEDYNYIVKQLKGSDIELIVQTSSGKTLFQGSPQKFLDEYLKQLESEE